MDVWPRFAVDSEATILRLLSATKRQVGCETLTPPLKLFGTNERNQRYELLRLSPGVER
jgi:hypothetical protein